LPEGEWISYIPTLLTIHKIHDVPAIGGIHNWHNVMKRGWLKNTALATILSTTLTACGGGGGGGGAVGTVTNFVQDDLSSLSGSSSIVGSYSSLLSDFNQAISGGDFGSLTGVITGPDADDIATANTLLTQLDTAVALWSQSEALIEQQSDADKYRIYNSNSYKEAYAAMVYLKEHVKPIIQKVSLGKTITLEDYNKVAKEDRAEEIIKAEKETTASTYAATKLVKKSEDKSSTEVVYDEIVEGAPVEDFSASSWAPVEGGGGREQRTVKVTTPQTKIVRTKVCTWTDTTKFSADGTTTVSSEPTCSISEQTTELAPRVEDVVQYQEGSNPVVSTVVLADSISDPVTEFNSAYGTDGELVDPQEQSRESKTEVVAGSETTTTENYTKTRTESTGTKNQVWVIVDNYTKTTVTKPAVSTTYDVVTYNDVKTKQKRTWTITTKRKEVTYKDGTTEIIETPQDKAYTDWTTVQVSAESRTVKENEVSTDIFLTPDITDTFVSQASKTLKDNAYTDDDEDLGTKTTDLSTVADDFKTAEFNKDSSKSMINADKAYARGWTGKGAVLGVIDSYQQTDHEALDGKYKWYNDYVRYEDGTTDANGNELGTVANGGKNISHGTHVAGIVAGKRDGTQFHGVAFDADLVGANIDYQGSGSPHMSYATSALKDIAKLKSTEAQGGEGMNIVAVNMSFNRANANFHYGDITQLSDGTYTASKITDRMNGGGGAQYWRVGTDNDIVLVNSAGNGIYKDGEMNYDFSLDPGIYATEVDNAGNLVLGGKMVIVGNWGGTKAEGQVVGSKAGHVCLDIDTINNICNDRYKVSDFYILAPGNSVYSSVPGDGYATMGGSSMAAPQVTGAMGILHQMWPHMKGENLVKLVLNTADKDINNYNENIHGQGMLDLDEATKPQGAIGIPTTGRVDGATSGLNSTYFATGTGSAFSSLGNIKIMVLDDYDRDYYIKLGDTFTVKDNRKYSDTSMLVNNNHTFLPTQQMYGSFSQGGQWDLVKDYNFGFYTGENGNGDYSTNIGKNFFITDRFKLKTGVGTMSEQDTWLGNSSDGVLAVGDNNVTNFGNIGVDYQIGNNVLSLDYNRGRTDINTVDNSLIKSFSDVETESYRLAYEIHKDKHNTLGWSFSLPSHITSGTMDLEVAESVNLDGTINYETIRSDLTQSTKEKNIGFYLNHTPEHDTDAAYNFTAEYRQDVAGQSGKDGINLAMNYTKKFWGSCKFLWMKNPKCYTKDENGKQVLTANMQKLMFGHNNTDPATKLGLRYDLKTDMFVPINPKDTKWKQ
jgi:hypothetical protein